MIKSSSSLAPFRNSQYLSYWLTGLTANFGWLIQMVGASWLMISIGGSPEMVALVQTSISLPVVLFSLTAGALADTFGRRTLVMWSQSFLLAVSAALAVVTYMGFVSPWMLLGFTFLIGSGKALNNPGWQTLPNEFVPREELPAAIALNSVGFNIARSVGPAIGGAIVATIGAFAAFAVNALSNVWMLIVLARWRGPALERELPPEPVGGAMMAGIRYVAMSPHILLVILRATVFNFAAISVMALMPLIARDLVHGGPATYGFLLGAFGVGAICAALVLNRVRQRLSLEATVRVGFVTFAASTAVIAISPDMLLTAPVIAIAGASWLLTMSTFNTTVQMSSPRWVVSRSHALYQTAAFGGNALGSFIWGAVAAKLGTGGSLLVSSVVLLCGAVLGLRFALRELDILGLDPHTAWTKPDIALDILPQSGPILTTIEYEIREEDIDEFLAIMAERRRTRTRDGARHWSLSRDIENPSLWIERYHTPTWVDTVRYHARRTQADAQTTERVRALHQGPGRPQVRHHLDRRARWSVFSHPVSVDH